MKALMIALPIWAWIIVTLIAVFILWNILAIIGAIIGLLFWVIGSLIHSIITLGIIGLIIWGGYKVWNWVKNTIGKETIS
ncbi:MAG: hypothetical protein Q7S33_02380 [Nanoarchaeota archaeon]|nr:hypothetical protein [Nanoarchaeota archaeon]